MLFSTLSFGMFVVVHKVPFLTLTFSPHAFYFSFHSIASQTVFQTGQDSFSFSSDYYYETFDVVPFYSLWGS